MVMETAEAVRDAIAGAGIDGPDDVHFVQIKCPLLTGERVEAAKSARPDGSHRYTYPSIGYSRAAAALGIAVALGEIPLERIADKAVGATSHSGRRGPALPQASSSPAARSSCSATARAGAAMR